jgi:hypothetical protein
MLSPGFVGVAVLPGQHSILLRYQPGFWKVIMALGGLLLAGVIVAAERRGYLMRVMETQTIAVPVPAGAGISKRRRR